MKDSATKSATSQICKPLSLYPTLDYAQIHFFSTRKEQFNISAELSLVPYYITPLILKVHNQKLHLSIWLSQN